MPAESSASSSGMLPGLSRVTDFAKKLVGKQNSSGVQIGGVDDVLVRFGRCCNPVPGDPIAGFITRGRGVTVHTVGCDKALATDPERRVDVSWDVRGDFKRPVTLRVLTADRPGPAGGHLQHLLQEGREHLPGQLPRHRGRPRGEHLRGHHLGPEAAHGSDAHHRAPQRRLLRRAHLASTPSSWGGVAPPRRRRAGRLLPPMVEPRGHAAAPGRFTSEVLHGSQDRPLRRRPQGDRPLLAGGAGARREDDLPVRADPAGPQDDGDGRGRRGGPDRAGDEEPAGGARGRRASTSTTSCAAASSSPTWRTSPR